MSPMVIAYYQRAWSTNCRDSKVNSFFVSSLVFSFFFDELHKTKTKIEKNTNNTILIFKCRVAASKERFGTCRCYNKEVD
jgi:hypothetical protein